MNADNDLSAQALEGVLGGRPLQTHPVLLSTAVTATEWAEAGAPDGAVVVADYQIAPRGRAGRPWKVTPGRGLGFALVLRPQLTAERVGWLYTVILTALADVSGEAATIEWPDEIRRQGTMAAAVGIDVRLRAQGVKWAVVNVLTPDAQPPRGKLLGSLLQAIESREASSPSAVLADYEPICATIGRSVHVRLLGGAARFDGRAVEILDDGALVLELADGRRVPIRPQHVSSLVSVQEPPAPSG
jgi:BirA family biotin operon repressor/biotin-[acetyl-CoA-carboxylase] ligase